MSGLAGRHKYQQRPAIFTCKHLGFRIRVRDRVVDRRVCEWGLRGLCVCSDLTELFFVDQLHNSKFGIARVLKRDTAGKSMTREMQHSTVCMCVCVCDTAAQSP